MARIKQEFVKFDPKDNRLICQGEWDLEYIVSLKKQLKKITLPANKDIIVDGKAITKLDSACAWLLLDWIKKSKNKITLENFSDERLKLLTLIKNETISQKDIPRPVTPNWVVRVGRFACYEANEFYKYLSFIGQLSLEGLYLLMHPTRLRFKATISVIDKTGYQALPIIALISFMIGVVIAYQMGNQLRNYGANVFIVDLLGLSVLREFGPLLAAIMVAGRTGSAFTAQIGIMRINQEIDALDTMGVTPIDLLLLPRLVGLLIVLPLLTIWADLFGVLGGMLMANNLLGVSPHDFLLRFPQEIPLRTLLIGLSKAPIFAMIIGSVGCFQGMEVHGSAESVGTHTTRSVVVSIFLIIITDAFFSILFSEFKL